MRKEQITDKEAFCLIFLFTTGSTLILGIGGEAKNDAWIAAIAGALMAVPFIAIYSRLVSLFQGKDLFQILECVFGKVLGKIISILYIWYAFHLGSLVLRNFGEFIKTVAMPETPLFVSIIGLGIICIYIVNAGVEVMGRFSAYFLPMLLAIILFVQLLAIPSFEPEFILPILAEGLMPVLKGGFSAFSFPFAETVLLMGAFFSLKTRKSPFKVYFNSLLFTGLLIAYFTFRNIMLLGSLLPLYHFPSHVAVSRIQVGDFIQRIELTVAVVFLVGVYIKTSVCLLTACRGIAQLFNLYDYRSVVLQVGLLMSYLAYFIYDDIMTMQYWAFKVYQYYAFPFQVVIPLALWVTAEIRKKKLICQSNG